MTRRTATTDARAQRAQLEAEEINLRERQAAVAEQIDGLRRKLADIERGAQAQTVRAARHGDLVDTTDSTTQATYLRAEIIEQQALARALAAEAAKVPHEIAELHRHRWDEFSTDAEQQTQLALAALATLEENYRAAYESWQTAKAAWERPITDLDTQEDQQEQQGRSAMSNPRMVPAFPLALPSDVFTACQAPRPCGFIPRAERSRASKPGIFRAADSGAEHYLDELGVRSNEIYIKPDRRGFARWLRVSD